MKTIPQRFGTFAGIDANGSLYTAGNSEWLSSLEEMAPVAQRDAFVGLRELTDGVSTSSSGLTGIGQLYVQPRLRAMLDSAGFGFINNCEGERQPSQGDNRRRFGDGSRIDRRRG